MTVAQLEAQILNQLGFAGTAILSDLTPDMLLEKLNQAAEQVANDVPLLRRDAYVTLTSGTGEYALPSDVLSIEHNAAEIVDTSVVTTTDTSAGTPVYVSNVGDYTTTEIVADWSQYTLP